ncbi:hypothetical protein SASC598J21_005100, partial [Snodgrassella alvi SCGC AB-598-J21]
ILYFGYNHAMVITPAEHKNSAVMATLLLHLF